MARQRLFCGGLAALGGLVLFESLFLPWYGVDVEVAGVPLGNSLSAWQARSALDLLLLLAALAALAGGALTVRSARFAPLALAAGAAGICLSLAGLADLPDAGLPAVPGDTVEVERRIGAFVALVASLGVAFAGARATPGRSRRDRRPRLR